MSNLHDRTFKELVKQRSFFEPFIKTYLPKGLLKRLDWRSVKFYKMGGRHLEDNTHNEFEADVIYLAEIGGKTSFIWLHAEHQSTPDKYIVLRVVNYQSAELLTYARQNPNKPLPMIVTILYYQGKNPWGHSLNLKDLFAEPNLAMKYFARPILVDLPATSDKELMQHQEIGPIEVILKHVRRKDFGKGLNGFVAGLRTVDGQSRKTVLRYLIQVADVSGPEWIKIADQCLPGKDKEFIVTAAEQWMAEGMQQGMQQGIQQGMETERLAIAKSLLLRGAGSDFVAESTGLLLDLVLKLQQEITH